MPQRSYGPDVAGALSVVLHAGGRYTQHCSLGGSGDACVLFCVRPHVSLAQVVLEKSK